MHGALKLSEYISCCTVSMDNFQIYTAADDSRILQFRRFVDFFQAFNPGVSLNVIPFGDTFTLINEECKKNNYRVVEPCPIIDKCGQSIFQDIEYRKSIVKSWRYMRKLNSFIDSKHPFAFLDVNNLPFHHLSVYKTILEKSKKDILFRGKSSKYRTLARKHHSLLNHLDEKIGTGYNCSIILSNPNTICRRDIEFLSSPSLKTFIGKSPEQGYLCLLLCLTKLTHNKIKNEIGKDNFILSSPNLDLNSLTINYKDKTIQTKQGKTLLNFKYTGTDLRNIPDKIMEFVKTLKNTNS